MGFFYTFNGDLPMLFIYFETDSIRTLRFFNSLWIQSGLGTGPLNIYDHNAKPIYRNNKCCKKRLTIFWFVEGTIALYSRKEILFVASYNE